MITTQIFASQYQFHPKSRIYLSGGYNPYFPNRGYLDCIEHDGIRETQNKGSVSSQIEISVISSQETLMNKMGFSSLIESSAWFLSGDLYFSKLTESLFKKKHQILIVNV